MKAAVIFSSHLIYKDFFDSAGCQGPGALPPPLTVRGAAPVPLSPTYLYAYLYNIIIIISPYL